MNSTLLVAGIGNIFFGDDAFGCEVAHELLRRPLRGGVEVDDFGIRGYDLAYAMMDERDAILIDAVPRGHAPGTLFLIEPDLDALEQENAAPPDGHSMTPVSVLRLVKSLGGKPGKLYLVGCEPSVFEAEEGAFGLSEPMRAAVPKAVDLVESLIEKILRARDENRGESRPALVGAREEVN